VTGHTAAHRSSAPSKRTLASIYEPDADGKRPPESLYGSLKMSTHLHRQGIPVARRTVEGLRPSVGPSAMRSIMRCARR
jgi:putative transposase